MRIFLVLSILGGFEASFAAASDAPLRSLSKDSTLSFGNPPPAAPLPAAGFRLLCWNIYKGAFPEMPQDFGDLSYGADLALFQEMVSSPELVFKVLAANPKFSWTLAKSFATGNGFTGVATGSRILPLREEAIISEAREPISATPKTILLSEFPIENSTSTLLVANIHGINFVTRETYKTQIHQLLEKVTSHQGPLIIAGDFNTWGDGRLDYLKQVFGPLGLKQIAFPAYGYLNLDHVFARGVTSRFIFDLGYIQSSDHRPLMMDLNFDPPEVAKHENTP